MARLTTFLKTKLYIPPARPRERVVPRPRLLERLDQGIRSGCKLILISAPAGFGKTTLASEWVHQTDAPTAWLSLDEGDNDPTRFWSYVVAALQTVGPPARTRRDARTAHQGSALHPRRSDRWIRKDAGTAITTSLPTCCAGNLSVCIPSGSLRAMRGPARGTRARARYPRQSHTHWRRGTKNALFIS